MGQRPVRCLSFAVVLSAVVSLRAIVCHAVVPWGALRPSSDACCRAARLWSLSVALCARFGLAFSSRATSPHHAFVGSLCLPLCLCVSVRSYMAPDIEAVVQLLR